MYLLILLCEGLYYWRKDSSEADALMMKEMSQRCSCSATGKGTREFLNLVIFLFSNERKWHWRDYMWTVQQISTDCSLLPQAEILSGKITL